MADNVRELKFGDSGIVIDTAPYKFVRDVVRFERGAQNCPSCEGEYSLDVASISVEGWSLHWCSCGAVWGERDGKVEVLADWAEDYMKPGTVI